MLIQDCITVLFFIGVTIVDMMSGANRNLNDSELARLKNYELIQFKYEGRVGQHLVSTYKRRLCRQDVTNRPSVALEFAESIAYHHNYLNNAGRLTEDDQKTIYRALSDVSRAGINSFFELSCQDRDWYQSRIKNDRTILDVIARLYYYSGIGCQEYRHLFGLILFDKA